MHLAVFGDISNMLPIAPLMLLFSYTRTHKNKLIDFAVPVVGAGDGICGLFRRIVQGGLRISQVRISAEINSAISSRK